MTPESIISETAMHYGMKPETIIGRARTRGVSYARHVAIYLLREHTQLSMKEIGSLLDGRDHATICYGRDRIRNEIEIYPEVQSEVEELNERLAA